MKNLFLSCALLLSTVASMYANTLCDKELIAKIHFFLAKETTDKHGEAAQLFTTITSGCQEEDPVKIAEFNAQQEDLLKKLEAAKALLEAQESVIILAAAQDEDAGQQ